MKVNYTMEELVRETGYAKRTIYDYAWRGLIPHPSHRGPGSTWPADTLKLLLAYKRDHHPDNRRVRATIAIEYGLNPVGY